MRLARSYSCREVRVEEASVPEIGPDEALLKVEACGLCSSDCLEWYVEKKCPVVLGHEPTGVLVRVGSRADGFEEGARVFTHHHVSCGECPACLRGADSSCRLFRETSLDPGGFAEYVRIPGENLRRDTQILPDSMSWETGTWIEPVACSLRIFTRCPPLTRDGAVMIIGLGANGLLNGMVARAKGAALLIGSDLVASRREKAVELGFDVTVDPLLGARDQVLSLTGGLGVDLVVVGPCSPEAIVQGLECAAPRGTVVLFTPTPPGMTVPIDPHKLYFTEISLTASYSASPAQTREAMRLLTEGRIDPSPLVSFRTGLDGLGEAIRRTLAKQHDFKSIIFPQRTLPR